MLWPRNLAFLFGALLFGCANGSSGPDGSRGPGGKADGDGDVPISCASSLDCVPGEVCDAGSCVAACTSVDEAPSSCDAPSELRRTYFDALQTHAIDALDASAVEVDTFLQVYSATIPDGTQPNPDGTIDERRLAASYAAMNSFADLLRAERHYRELFDRRGGDAAYTQPATVQNAIDFVFMSTGADWDRADRLFHLDQALEHLAGVTVYERQGATFVDHFTGEEVDPTQTDQYYLSYEDDVVAAVDETQGRIDFCYDSFRIAHLRDALVADLDALRAMRTLSEQQATILDVSFRWPGWLADRSLRSMIDLDADEPMAIGDFREAMRRALEVTADNIRDTRGRIVDLNRESDDDLLKLADADLLRAAVTSADERFQVVDCWIQEEISRRGASELLGRLALSAVIIGSTIAGVPALGVIAFALAAHDTFTAWTQWQQAQEAHFTSIDEPELYSREAVRSYQRSFMLNLALLVVDGVFTIRELRLLLPRVDTISLPWSYQFANLTDPAQIQQAVDRLRRLMTENATQNTLLRPAIRMAAAPADMLRRSLGDYTLDHFRRVADDLAGGLQGARRVRVRVFRSPDVDLGGGALDPSRAVFDTGVRGAGSGPVTEVDIVLMRSADESFWNAQRRVTTSLRQEDAEAMADGPLGRIFMGPSSSGDVLYHEFYHVEQMAEVWRTGQRLEPADVYQLEFFAWGRTVDDLAALGNTAARTEMQRVQLWYAEHWARVRDLHDALR